MQYLTMLYGDVNQSPTPSAAELDAETAGYMRFGEKNTKSILAGEALLGSDQAITVRAATTGTPLVTEGPFAETAEVIGGFYVLEADTLDEVIAIVPEIPMAKRGAIEVRPLAVWMADNYLTPSAPGTRYLGLMISKPYDSVPGTPEWDEMGAAHGAFMAAAGDAWIAGGALHPTGSATTVRVRGDEVLVTDGPVAESAEVVSGFYLLRGPDRDTVTDLAGRIPVAPGGAVELWRVLDLG